MREIETRDLSEQVYEVLRDGIVQGDLRQGEQLLDLGLAEQFGVSRTPVKNALNRLAAEGLVEIIPRRGTFVARVDRKRLEELWDIRRVVEMYAVEQAAHRITAEEVVKMRELLEDAGSLIGREDKSSQRRLRSINSDFHMLLVRASESEALIDLYTSLSARMQLRKVPLDWTAEEMGRSHNQHVSLLRAVERGDEVTAKEVLGVHLDRGRRIVLRTYGSRGRGTE